MTIPQNINLTGKLEEDNGAKIILNFSLDSLNVTE